MPWEAWHLFVCASSYDRCWDMLGKEHADLAEVHVISSIMRPRWYELVRVCQLSFMLGQCTHLFALLSLASDVDRKTSPTFAACQISFHLGKARKVSWANVAWLCCAAQA